MASRVLVYQKSGKILPRLWQNRKVPKLWEKLANEAKKFSVTKVHMRGSYERTFSTRNCFLALTPLTQVGHLIAQVALLKGVLVWNKPLVKAYEVKTRLAPYKGSVDDAILCLLKQGHFLTYLTKVGKKCPCFKKQNKRASDEPLIGRK